MIARFRTGSHGLDSETGRWCGTSRNDRVCRCCRNQRKLVEDEVHFIFDCELYYQIRGEFYEQLLENSDRSLRSFFSDENIVAAGLFLEKCTEFRLAHLAQL